MNDSITTLVPEALSLVTVLVKALESRDPYTAGHEWRVSRYTVDVAHRLGWHETACRAAELGAFLHDVGKIGIPDVVLLKQGPLTELEWATMRTHPEKGASILRLAVDLMPMVPTVEAHHERWDGTGYPHGLAGTAIPISARLVSVADAFDAMTSVRPYRPALPVYEALNRLAKGANTQWDPNMTQVFREAWDDGDFDAVISFSDTDLPLLPCVQCGPLIAIPPQSAADRSAAEVLCPGCGGAYHITYSAGGWGIAAAELD